MNDIKEGTKKVFLQLRKPVLTCYGNTKENGDGFSSLNKAPSFGEMSGSHSFHCKHFERVKESSEADTINPNKKSVSMIALNSTQGK